MKTKLKKEPFISDPVYAFLASKCPAFARDLKRVLANQKKRTEKAD